MLDFTRAQYLGLRHPSHALGSWDSLTTGVPAALASPADHGRVAQAVARLIGCERGTLGRSTLHLVWDLFGLWSRDRPAFYVDAGTYPIVRWGIEHAVCRGAVVRPFPHHDAEALCRLLRRDGWCRRRRIVVTDGWCPRCGRAAPLPDYLEAVRRFGGLLMIDDTQALGILGRRRGRDARPYGRGGGGSLRWFGLTHPDIVVVSSLAKGFGAPVAVLAGSRRIVARFEAESDTRVHASPPSAADVCAAQRALDVNARHGDALRRRLGRLVQRFRRGLARLGLAANGGSFAVQTLSASAGVDPVALHHDLQTVGVRTVLLRDDQLHGIELAFLINADHQPKAIDYAVEALARCLPRGRARHQREVPRAMSM